jgi:hypothetical protein
VDDSVNHYTARRAERNDIAGGVRFLVSDDDKIAASQRWFHAGAAHHHVGNRPAHEIRTEKEEPAGKKRRHA